MRRIIFSFAFILLTHMSLSAQQSSPAIPAQCPTVSVDYPTNCPTYGIGIPATFTALVSGAEANAKLTFNWTTSSGTILNGQGTPTVTITDAPMYRSLTMTVEVQGLPQGCANTASCTAIICDRVLSRKFDEYGFLSLRDEKARLDNFAIELDNNPGAQGYIIAYAGRQSQNRTRLHLDRAKNYLIKRHEIDEGRIVTIDGGYRDKSSVELWIVPTGAEPPQLKPSQ
jgi:hypothetical protein